MPIDPEKIKKEGVRLLEEFSEKLDKVEAMEGLGKTHYVLDLKNVTREDKKGKMKKDFKNKMKKIAPKWDEGYIVAEKGV